MATFLPIVKVPNPLAHFRQTSITPIGTGGSFLKFKGMPAPLAHFAQTSITPITPGGRYKPFPPLPGAGSSGGGGTIGSPL